MASIYPGASRSFGVIFTAFTSFGIRIAQEDFLIKVEV